MVVLVCAGLELFQKGREEKGEQEAAGSMPGGEPSLTGQDALSGGRKLFFLGLGVRGFAAVVGSFHGGKLAEAGKLVGEASLLPLVEQVPTWKFWWLPSPSLSGAGLPLAQCKEVL